MLRQAFDFSAGEERYGCTCGDFAENELGTCSHIERIKNWQAKTSQIVKALRSRFALVLSGTPLENRLDDLFSVVEFVDDRRLGPSFRFFNTHRVVDEKGKVLGYKNLDQLREKLKPILLRRTRATVMRQLPERTDEIVRIDQRPVSRPEQIAGRTDNRAHLPLVRIRKDRGLVRDRGGGGPEVHRSAGQGEEAVPVIVRGSIPE